MLTADLIRASVKKGVLTPRYVDPAHPQLQARADELVQLFERHVDKTRATLDEALDDMVGDETHFAITRGLCKLLHDRSTWETVAPIDPVALRRQVFEASAAAHPISHDAGASVRTSRSDVLAQVAAALGVTAEEVEGGLYADLRAEQRLTRFRSLSGLALIHRYNLALAQGLVMRAFSMTVHVEVDRPSRLRQVFRWLKFHQLMHRTTRSGRGYDIAIDGPLSLFAQSQRYGFQMAKFLPALLLADRWSLEAEVSWPHSDKPLTFALSPDAGLVTHLQSRGTWITDEESALTRRVDGHASAWKVSRRAKVVDLGGRDVLVPDFLVKCGDTGREVMVEIIGFWRRDYLERRIEVLRKYGPPNLVLCISRKMAAEKKATLEGFSGAVVDFAKVIPLNRFLECIEEVAC